MKRNNLFNRREKLSLAILMVLALVAIGFILWRSSYQPPSKVEGWVMYTDQDIPFTFDHPANWSITKDKQEYTITFTASDKSDDSQAILSIIYGKSKPGGLAVGISSCQGYVRSPKCSYIVNPMVSNFFHIEGNTYWQGNNPYKDGKITLNLIKQDQTSRDLLIETGKSIQSKE
ncbi:hypothetical protein PV379_04680 [Streptomyces caniscabiei]|uniref:hypothetical protein n=1 Tax=Streptomyces caniscabiei TaxID=2746961 RepID=UPI0029B27691|nr:hypothetical protein [Streptomyces caniscabiei]MDX2776628.1 hypothetical protein [Streptomyces caniscabiei]